MKASPITITVVVLILCVIVAGWGAIIPCLIIAGLLYLFALMVKALKRYLKSSEVREEKKESRKTLGEVLKNHRTDNKMTQEFVAEHLGVSRQAVSKWEIGASDPNTSNLIAIAKLFGTTPEELLQEVRGIYSEEK